MSFLIKRFVASVSSKSGISLCSFGVLKMLMPYIRIIYYHGTPARYANQFESHLQFYLNYFVPSTMEDLECLLNGASWPHSKPGLILTFDDGLRSNYTVAAPLLEQYGFSGCFFIPSTFIDTAPLHQVEFAKDHRIQIDEEYPDKRISISWDELKSLSRKHIIGCHTATHHRMHQGTSQGQLSEEIIVAKARIENQLGINVDSFSWVGGEENTYNTQAANMIRSAGYRYAFMTNTAPIHQITHRHQLNRTNVDASWNIDIVRFQLSGILDLIYIPKRIRVNAITAVDAPVQI